MPMYCYENDAGDVIEERFSVKDDIPKQITRGGRVYRRSFAAEGASVPATAGWPMECFASGVHPDQANDLRKEFQRVGVPTEVSKDGNPIYRNATHRKKALKARGFFDKSSFN